MDGYGKVFDSYWSGPTGRAIQASGKDATILGLYLPSTRHANMIGLYPLPLLYIAHDLPVLEGLDAIVAALAALADVDYAHYDLDTGMVWVVEMARIRCGLERKEPLVARDKRHSAIVRLYHEATATPLLDRFHTRYVDQLRLGERRPFDAPPKPLRRPSEASQQSAVSSQQSTVSIESDTHARAREARADAPLDVWFSDLLNSYPEMRVTHGYRTESAFHEQFHRDPRPAAEVWAEMRANLENQLAGYEWRIKRMVPTLEKWLSEGRWRQRHQAMPADALSDVTRHNMAALDSVLREEREAKRR